MVWSSPFLRPERGRDCEVVVQDDRQIGRQEGLRKRIYSTFLSPFTLTGAISTASVRVGSTRAR